MKERKQLNLQTHQIVKNPKGKGNIVIAEPHRTFIAMDKPNISIQSGMYFIAGTEATKEEVEALGFDTKKLSYQPDAEVQQAAERAAQSAKKVLAGRAGRQSEGTK